MSFGARGGLQREKREPRDPTVVRHERRGGLSRARGKPASTRKTTTRYRKEPIVIHIIQNLVKK